MSAGVRCLVVGALLLASAGALAHFDIKPWPPGKRVPTLELADIDGREWNAKSLRGKVVILNFWATWCEPCRAEMPTLAALAQKHSTDKLVVLAANYQESEPKIRRYLETIKAGFPILLDRDGAVAKAWTSRIFPTTIVIDSVGMPRHVVTGEYDWNGEAAARLLEPLLRVPNR